MVSGNGFHEIQIYPQPFPGAKLKGINRLFVMLAAGLLVLSHSKWSINGWEVTIAASSSEGSQFLTWIRYGVRYNLSK